MNKHIIILTICCCAFKAMSQVDTIKASEYDVTQHPCWTPRFSIGIQKTPFLEIGISRIGPLGDGSWCFYGSTEFNYRNVPHYSNSIYEFKLGYETSFSLLMGALEFKFLTDLDYSQYIITPKIGLSLYGYINILYGYNIYDDYEEFQGLGHHQISIIANINKKIAKQLFKN